MDCRVASLLAKTSGEVLAFLFIISYGGRGDAQMARGLDAALGHAGLGIGQVSQQAMAVLQKGAALVGERDAPGGTHQQLDAQALLQPVQAAPDDGRRHALGLGRRRQAAAP